MGSGSRCYGSDSELGFRRRINGRGQGYPISHDLPQGPYIDHRHSHEARNSQSTGSETNSSGVRRRIPVACGRCRKRKIRCSGDTGNGGPCTNCKSAGNDVCQFLRVQSQEAQFKSDASDSSFEAPATVVRPFRLSVPNGTQYLSTLSLDGFPCRQNSVPSIPYPIKYYNLPSLYSEVADGNVDYSLHTPPYPLLGPDQVGVSAYGGSSSGSGRWVHPIFSETLLQPGCQGTGYSIRPTIGPESKNLSLNGMASSLPVAGPDRVLPYPATGRQSQAPLVRPIDGHANIHVSQPSRSLDGLQTYNGVVSHGPMNILNALNDNSIADNSPMTTSYHALSGNSETHLNYASPAGTSHQGNEMYTASEVSRLYSGSQSSCEDLRRRTASRKQSHPDIAGTISSPSPTGTHGYQPLRNNGYYPVSPMIHPQLEIPATSRQSNVHIITAVSAS
ncbi:hypothetical protein B0O99DRAFT_680817 [Bisporella sp. PMI_857]|nr:hypothetical protein B0O99DRAFT_680817 [Bisporella sp. PMI_857]